MTTICQDCRKREAQVHLTQIVNNEKIALSLCKECAAARGFHSPLENVPFPLADILTGLANDFSAANRKSEPMASITCPGCSLTFEEFTHQGRFGCGECYRVFRIRLEPIMRKIHGASLHRGKNPNVTSDGTENSRAMIPIKEEERLESELRKAIEAEDFERAAELRDKLKTVRANLSLYNS